MLQRQTSNISHNLPQRSFMPSVRFSSHRKALWYNTTNTKHAIPILKNIYDYVRSTLPPRMNLKLSCKNSIYIEMQTSVCKDGKRERKRNHHNCVLWRMENGECRMRFTCANYEALERESACVSSCTSFQ